MDKLRAEEGNPTAIIIISTLKAWSALHQGVGVGAPVPHPRGLGPEEGGEEHALASDHVPGARPRPQRARLRSKKIRKFATSIPEEAHPLPNNVHPLAIY